jgi:hypothetical protein
MVAARADAAILVSEHMKQGLSPKVPVHILSSGVDRNLFRCMPQDEARRLLGLPQSERLVLFVGNPKLPVKRYELAERAVEVLNRSLPARLILCWKTLHQDIPVYMNACNVFAFTSVQEGSPDVIKEALACNLPIVSVPVGDVDVRLKGIDGCELCTDDAPETIAAGLERVLRAGRRLDAQEAIKDLDEAFLTQKLISIYESVLGCTKRHTARNGTNGFTAQARARATLKME